MLLPNHGDGEIVDDSLQPRDLPIESLTTGAGSGSLSGHVFLKGRSEETYNRPGGSPNGQNRAELLRTSFQWPERLLAVFREFGKDPLVLITDLEKAELTRTDLARIYKLRWKIEELYGLVQGPCLDQKQFHSRKPEGIEQEILALALFVNLVRTVSTLAADQEHAPRGEICEKEAVLTTKAYLTRLLLLANCDELEELIGWCLERIGTCLTKPRPGRSHPRVSYKPGSRWGPSGRRGRKKALS